jgi:hypothetical protein
MVVWKVLVKEASLAVWLAVLTVDLKEIMMVVY